MPHIQGMREWNAMLVSSPHDTSSFWLRPIGSLALVAGACNMLRACPYEPLKTELHTCSRHMLRAPNFTPYSVFSEKGTHINCPRPLIGAIYDGLSDLHSGGRTPASEGHKRLVDDILVRAHLAMSYQGAEDVDGQSHSHERGNICMVIRW